MSEVKAKKNGGKVAVFIEKGNLKDEPMQFIAVNGKSILVPKGKTVESPAEFAAEYERARRAKAAYMNSMEAKAYKGSGNGDPLS